LKEALEEKLGRSSPRTCSPAARRRRRGRSTWPDGTQLLVRRASVGVIHRDTLTLEQEFRVLEAAVARRCRGAAADPVPRRGRGARGVRDGARRRRDDRAPHRPRPSGRAAEQLAEQLARIHAVEPLDFLPRGDVIARFYDELDSVGEPHPAIEYGLAWVRERLPPAGELTFCHGDFRDRQLRRRHGGLVAVLDWEFAHVGDPVEDVAWPIVRAWRSAWTAKRLGGVGEVEPYLERYNELTGRNVTLADLDVWEVFGKLQVGDRLPHAVAATPERAGPKRRVRGARADGGRDGVRAPRPDLACLTAPDAAELIEAVFEFLAEEVLPRRTTTG
jgi:aminoglycoside phosphotransferase (APT) family kinase protein